MDTSSTSPSTTEMDGRILGPDSLERRMRKNTILISHGRPPWYSEAGDPLYPAFVIGIAGGSASGKTHVAQQIVKALGNIPSVVILSQDSFYKPHGSEELKLAFENKYDFDHPNALDLDLFAECLSNLKANQQTNVPVYSFVQHQRLVETRYLYGPSIVIAEGIMTLHDPHLRSLYDLKVFVQCDSDLMLARRIRRDVADRGRDVGGVIDQYLRFVKPAYDNFVLPSSRHADIIVPGSDNGVAIELISEHVKRQLAQRAACLREKMARSQTALRKHPSPLPSPKIREASLESNIILMEQTTQLQGIYTILRNETSMRSDFIFYADRLATVICERSMCELPFRPRTVTCPTTELVAGKELAAQHLVGVSIIRSGGAFERGLRRVLRDVALGSLLIQSDPKSGEPLLLHTMVPDAVRDRNKAVNTWVLLLDAQIVTGATALMAIRVLRDHGVREDRILFLTFVVARGAGVNAIQKAFPKVKVITGAIDDVLSERWLTAHGEGTMGTKLWVIEPGLGSISNRYF